MKVATSLHPDPDVRRAENDRFAVVAIQPIFHLVRAEHPDWPPQPCLLHALRLAVEGQEGRRNQAREDSLFPLFVEHIGGFVALARLLGVTL